MTTQTTEPQDRPEIQTADDLLTAIRTGMEIATRADIGQSERRVIERVGERFDAQDKRMDARFDAQDARFDAQDARLDAQGAQLNTQGAQLNENTAAIRELKASMEADRRKKDRAIQWLSITIGALGVLAAIIAAAVTIFGG